MTGDAGFEVFLTYTSLELRAAAMEGFDMEASLGFARAVMTRTYQLWEAADPDQKRRLQKLIFPEGVSFDGDALRTPVTVLIFSMLSPEMTQRERFGRPIASRLEIHHRLAARRQRLEPASGGGESLAAMAHYPSTAPV